MNKKILPICCFAFFSLKSWANNNVPIYEEPIDPPPDNVSINSFLNWAFFIAVAMVAYYFNRSNKTFLQNK